MKVTPQPWDEESRLIDFDKTEYHEVPFGGIAVDLLADQGLRDTLARFFRPSYRPMWSEDKERTALWDMFYNVVPEGEFPRVGERFRKENPDTDIKLRIILDYPLNTQWYADVTIKASRLGDIFGIAYDMYCHIYDLDNAEWQKQGHQDRAPSQGSLDRAEGKEGPFLINRASGVHVWGHDMSDLVFESVGFSLNKKWPNVERKKIVVKSIEDGEISPEELLDNRSKYTGPAPIGHESTDAEMHIGIVTFGIGS